MQIEVRRTQSPGTLWHEVIVPFLSYDCPRAALWGAQLGFYGLLICCLEYLLPVNWTQQDHLIGQWVQLSGWCGLGVLLARIVSWLHLHRITVPPSPPPLPDLVGILNELAYPPPPPVAAWITTIAPYQIATTRIRITPTQQLELRWGRRSLYPDTYYLITVTLLVRDTTPRGWHEEADVTPLFMRLDDEPPPARSPAPGRRTQLTPDPYLGRTTRHPDSSILD